MSSRLEFVTLALSDAANVAELCRRFKVSRKTGHKWIKRFRAGGAEALPMSPHTYYLCATPKHGAGPTWLAQTLDQRLLLD